MEVFERLEHGEFCFPGVSFLIPGMGGAVKKAGGLDSFGVGQAWSFGVGMAWGPAVGGFILTVILVVLPLPLLFAVFMGPKCCVDLGRVLSSILNCMLITMLGLFFTSTLSSSPLLSGTWLFSRLALPLLEWGLPADWSALFSTDF